jgi:hypothetical protein
LNIGVIFITYLLDSVWRSIFDNFRPVSVWALDLLLFYVFTKHTLGEPWTTWSWLQLAGMFLLFYGTAVYNGNVRMRCFDYTRLEETQDITAEETRFAFENSPAYGTRSPYLCRSPPMNRSPYIELKDKKRPVKEV